MKIHILTVSALSLALASATGCSRRTVSSVQSSAIDSVSLSKAANISADSLRLHTDFVLSLRRPRIVLCRGDSTAMAISADEAVATRNSNFESVGSVVVSRNDSTTVSASASNSETQSRTAEPCSRWFRWIAIALGVFWAIRAYRGIVARR